MRWDKYNMKLTKLGSHLDLYMWYVDDTVCVLQAIQKGWMYCRKEDKMFFKKDLMNTTIGGTKSGQPRHSVR